MKRVIGSLVCALVAASQCFSTTPAYAAIATEADSVLGQGGSFTTGAPGSTLGSLRTPTGTALDKVHHRLWVADKNNNRILSYNLTVNNTLMDDVADNYLGNGAAAAQANTFNGPSDVAYDPVGDRLFVADGTNSRVMVFNTSSLSDGMSAELVLGEATFTSNDSVLSDSTDLYSPQALTLDPLSRRLYVIDTRRVIAYDLNNLATNMSASFVLGQSNFTSAGGGSGTKGMTAPNGLAVDPNRKLLFVLDGWLNRAMVFDTSALANNMDASWVIGQPNLSTYSAGQSASQLYLPTEITTDGNTVYISDGNSNRVVGYDYSTPSNGPTAFVVYGQSNFAANAAATTRSGMSMPRGLHFDAAGAKLYVADSANNRVLIFNTQKKTEQTIVSVDVLPVLTFTVSSFSGSCNGANQTAGLTATAQALDLGHLATGSSTVAQGLTVSTNAASGFVAYLRTATPLQSGSRSFEPVLGTDVSPAAFPATGTEAFGYTTSSATLSGVADRFTTAGPLWAAVTGSQSEVAASNGPAVSATCVAYRAQSAPGTPAGNYSGTFIYTAVPRF